MKTKPIAGRVLIAILALSLPLHAEEKNDGTTLTHIGQKAPAFEINTLDGKKTHSSDLKGKIVFLNFFATWCGACLEDLPKLEKEIWDRFGQNPHFAMIAVGREETQEALEQFRSKRGYRFPMAPDPERKVYLLFATRWIPRHYLIDTDGTLLAQDVGEEDPQREKMVAHIEKRLAEMAEEKKSR